MTRIVGSSRRLPARKDRGQAYPGNFRLFSLVCARKTSFAIRHQPIGPSPRFPKRVTGILQAFAGKTLRGPDQYRACAMTVR